MPSKQNSYEEAYVWIWLPDHTEPVVAGKLTPEGNTYVFNYGRSYLERPNRISIHEAELPLKTGAIPLLNGLTMPGCIRDGSPDAWGRRVLINRKFGALGKAIDNYQLDELTFLLESGSDRIGALDFQLSPTHYEPRLSSRASLEELIQSADRVEKGEPLTPELDQALYHGSPIGGARPKALIVGEQKKYIAKFSSTSDTYNVIKGEYIAMRLAHLAGINVGQVTLTKAANRDVLLIERFDRSLSKRGWERKCLVSTLTLFQLDEMYARYASYEVLAELIRYKFVSADPTLEELFKRMVFNILVGNTDDHARNHAAFWDGKMLSLTPAYDICPQPRSGNEATQAMLINGHNRMSQISNCLNAARNFHLNRSQAIAIVESLITAICSHWNEVCENADVNPTDRKMFSTRQFFNPFAFERLDTDCMHLADMAGEFRSRAGNK